MTGYEFNKLTFKERQYLCLTEGEVIGTIDYYGQKIVLYLIDGLYIELFHTIETNEVITIDICAKERLGLYAKDVDISEIL